MQDAWKVTTFRLLWNRSLLQLRLVVILTVKTPKFSNNRNSKSADIESKYWYEYACHWTGLEHCFRNKPFFFLFLTSSIFAYMFVGVRILAIRQMCYPLAECQNSWGSSYKIQVCFQLSPKVQKAIHPDQAFSRTK